MSGTRGDPVWLISGCSSGFGRELCRAVIERGWRVVATARDPATLADIVGLAPDRVLALPLDICRADEIEAAVAAALARFGQIDALVNNAGYGYRTSVEEADDAQVRAMFETNFFGLVRLTQAVLPLFREQRSGHIINIGSVAGIVGVPMGGFYAASKHAVEGFSEALAGEVEPLGIRVTVIEPGPFRTDFAGRSIKVTAPQIAEYQETIAPMIALMAKFAGKEPGDPARAARIIIDCFEQPEPPRTLILGADTVNRARDKFQARLNNVEALRDLSVAADFPS